MVTQAELLKKLAELKNELKYKFGIEEFALFGSYARNEATQSSDVDIAILKMHKKDLSKRLAAKAYLENMLQKKIDIGYFDSMKTFIKNRIRKDLIYV